VLFGVSSKMRSHSYWSKKTGLILACSVLSLGFFAVDLSIPLGVAAGVPYVAVVLIALRIPDPRYTYGFAAVCTVLTILGYLFSTELAAAWQVVTNRMLALFAIWATALLSIQLRQSLNTTRDLRSRLANISRLTEMGAVTAGIAHEINQPLAAIATYCEACKRFLDADHHNPDELKDALVKAAEQAHRAGLAIQKIRSMVTQGEIDMQSLESREVLSTVLELLEGDAERYGIGVRVVTRQDLPPIKANQAQLQRVLLNLVNNALEAMREAGHSDEEIVIRVGRGSCGCVEFSVEDSGNGVAPEIEDELFEPFVTTRPGGVGMGLTVSRSIIQAHGGKLDYQPRQPSGSIFRFQIPAESAN
jgi:C4-dicarboxylate-specific signal transduction histidine kinase